MTDSARFDSSQTAPEVREIIAERAYFKAQQRGFIPGYEMADWLEAEREYGNTTMPETGPRPMRKRKPATSKVKKKRASAKA